MCCDQTQRVPATGIRPTRKSIAPVACLIRDLPQLHCFPFVDVLHDITDFPEAGFHPLLFNGV